MVILIFLAAALVYFLTSAGNTAYNHYTLLADAFLHGRLYIEGIMPWLEKVPRDTNSFYVVNPPLPAVLSIPFVAVFGKSFPQQYIAHLVGGLVAAVVYLIAKKVTGNTTKALFIAMLAGLGNIMWFLSSVGSIWYLAQITGSLFLLAAIYEKLNKNRPFIVGLLLTAACLARIQLLFSLPFFLFFDSAKNKKYFLSLFTGLLPFFFLYFWYNYARFGNILQAGYTLIPGITKEPWFAKGPFHYSYIQNHLKIILFALPKINDTFPYLFATWSGLAIWFTTPAFVYALKNKLTDRKVVSTWVAIFAIAVINFSYGSVGISQFGYRYAADFYPFLFLLVAYSLKNHKLAWHHWSLLLVSILVNLWGVLWINKFGWVVF